MRNKKNLRRVSYLVNAQTDWHVKKLAQMEGTTPGHIIDKLVRDRMLALQMGGLGKEDRLGRIKILPKPEANTCGSCGHFRRIAGKSLGTCGEQAYYKTRRGEIEPGRGTFMPSQSRKACKKYIQAAENEE